MSTGEMSTGKMSTVLTGSTGGHCCFHWYFTKFGFVGYNKTNMPCECGYPDGMSPLGRMVFARALPSGKPSSLWETFNQDTHTGMAYLYNVKGNYSKGHWKFACQKKLTLNPFVNGFCLFFSLYMSNFARFQISLWYQSPFLLEISIRVWLSCIRPAHHNCVYFSYLYIIVSSIFLFHLKFIFVSCCAILIS